MAGNLSGELVDGIGHSCWPIRRLNTGSHRQKIQKMGEPGSMTACAWQARLCRRRLDAAAVQTTLAAATSSRHDVNQLSALFAAVAT
jgi:hypothetical protein